MLSLLLLAPLAVAPQQNLRLESVTQANQIGQITGSVEYGFSFSSGWEIDANGLRQAMRYGDGGPLSLGAFAVAGQSQAEAVDVVGQVVGWAEGEVNGVLQRMPFRYTDAEGLTAIVLPNSSEGWAEDISIFGQSIVGTMRMSDGSLRAWELDNFQNTVAEALETPAGWESEALASEGEFIGGLVRDPNGREFAAIWNFQRELSLVTTPGTGNARITGVGFAGTDRICGWYLDTLGHAQSFFTDANTPDVAVTVLPTLGGTWCLALATDGHEVVGSSADAQGQARAFSYKISTSDISDLNDRALRPNGKVLTSAPSVEFGPILAVNGVVGNELRGFIARRLELFASPASAGQQASLQVASAPIDTLAVYVYGFNAGLTPVSGCPGLFVDIDQPRIVGRGRTSETGNHFVVVNVPAGAAGLTVLTQAILLEACMSTEVVPVTVN